MKRINLIIIGAIALMFSANIAKAQDNANKLKFSGNLLTDERFLLQAPNDWAWNENRLTLELEKKFNNDKGKFYSEVWLRNIGLPRIYSNADLYNKNIIEPYNLEIREAYVQLYGFLTKNLDLKIGKQRIAWGTADKLNPTDNLNPYDLEDVLDFGRHRGSWALNLEYYFGRNFSIQAVYIPVFQPANLPIGIFAKALTPTIEMPPPFVLKGFTDEVLMPAFNLGESATAGAKFKGFAGGVDFSLSYVWGWDGFPIGTYTTITPADTFGEVNVNVQTSFFRQHIFGADLATSIGGVGVWAEAAAFLPENDVVMTTDFSAMLPPGAPGPGTEDSVVLKKEVFFKYVIGADYNFANGMYLNFQYMHGFINERGRDALNDYFFVQYQMKFFEDKLKITPVAGGFIVSDWGDIKNNYAIIYAPELSYMATDNLELNISAALFDGKGNNLFANFVDYNMLMFKVKYSF